MDDIAQLFEQNRLWAAAMQARDAEYFERLLPSQKPRYFWIGCVDSRIEPNRCIALGPGKLLVHRNVANIVASDDLSVMAALQFAVEVLRVGHILVVGHEHCGGIAAALTGEAPDLTDQWLGHVRAVNKCHAALIEALPDLHARCDLLCELNAVEQARHVCQSPAAQNAWARGQQLAVHAWIYGLSNGLLRDAGFSVGSAVSVDSAYADAIKAVAERHHV